MKTAHRQAARAKRDVIQEFVESQHRLPPDIEKLMDEHAWELYSRTDNPKTDIGSGDSWA